MIALLKQFGSPEPLLKLMPEWLIKMIDLTLVQFIELKEQWEKKVIVVKEEVDSGTSEEARTIFQAIFESDSPPTEKSVDQLVVEAQMIVTAGTVTTANMLAITSYHLLNSPPIRARLQQELAQSSADCMTWNSFFTFQL